MIRVQIPTYTDRWMMGDRFGTIEKTSVSRPKHAVRAALPTGASRYDREVAHVRLDKSGKLIRVILADCEVLA
jgi:hypothetical protein